MQHATTKLSFSDFGDSRFTEQVDSLPDIVDIILGFVHKSPSSIPYALHIHCTATGGSICVLGVTPQGQNISLC